MRPTCVWVCLVLLAAMMVVAVRPGQSSRRRNRHYWGRRDGNVSYTGRRHENSRYWGRRDGNVSYTGRRYENVSHTGRRHENISFAGHRRTRNDDVARRRKLDDSHMFFPEEREEVLLLPLTHEPEEDVENNTTPFEQSVQFFRYLNNLTNVKDFLKILHHDNKESEVYAPLAAPTIDSRFGDHTTEATMRSTTMASVAPMAPPASCQPEEQTVPLTSNTNPTLLFWPTCTRVKKCGGCCSHDLLQCEPSETRTRTFRIVKSEFVEGSATFRGFELVDIEEDLKCVCGCKIKEKDCTKFQMYNKDGCRCECNNDDDKSKCSQQQILKFWDPVSCQCKCKKDSLCSSGYYFSEKSCRCEHLPEYNRAVTARRLPVDDNTPTVLMRRGSHNTHSSIWSHSPATEDDFALSNHRSSMVNADIGFPSMDDEVLESDVAEKEDEVYPLVGMDMDLAERIRKKHYHENEQ